MKNRDPERQYWEMRSSVERFAPDYHVVLYRDLKMPRCPPGYAPGRLSPGSIAGTSEMTESYRKRKKLSLFLLSSTC